MASKTFPKVIILCNVHFSTITLDNDKGGAPCGTMIPKNRAVGGGAAGTAAAAPLFLTKKKKKKKKKKLPERALSTGYLFSEGFREFPMPLTGLISYMSNYIPVYKV